MARRATKLSNLVNLLISIQGVPNCQQKSVVEGAPPPRPPLIAVSATGDERIIGYAGLVFSYIIVS